ncbi:MAG: ParB N-terminal domain-containing protein [candidate division Zixibacteria bacterium]|nr:ParB N-terminal domain-containing protein [candidate division Zixibacteria bacterium]
MEQPENISFKKLDDLLFDEENARFAGLQSKASQLDIAKNLWEEMHLDELIISIAVNGYYIHEPLLVIEKQKKYIVVEGNRRLAAVKILLDPKFAKYVGAKPDDLLKISKKRAKELNELPVMIYGNRRELWSYLSFRHINGPRSWSAISKAEFVDYLHEQGIGFEEILRSTGDRNRTSIKLYNGLMVLRQGEEKTRFSRGDFNATKLNFSHLYTLIQYPVTRRYLGIEKHDYYKPFPKNPVPKSKFKELEELLIWIFGSRKLKKEGIIKSQNPDLRMLDDVIGYAEALDCLRETGNLSDAHEYTEQEDRRLESYVIRAERNIRKAKSVEDAFKGDKVLVDKVRSIMEISNEMLNKMQASIKE